MKLGLGPILDLILPIFFTETGLQYLARDMQRRFSKAAFQNYGVIAKIRYLFYNIQYKTLVYYRLAVACRFPILRRLLMSAYQKLSLRTGIEFVTPEIGGGVIMPHWGRIILSAKQIGNDLYVFHNVTIGNDYTSGTPTIGNNVFIGTNCVILGDIKIGDNVVIGACSFVNSDIPSNSMAAGNPAKVLRTIDDNFITELLGY